MNLLIAVVLSMRPQQWIKNLVVFAALVFAQELTDPSLLLRTVLAALLFCGVSGAVYILNDLFDADRDRKHPIKARRPIAAGVLGSVQALTVVVLLLSASLMAGFMLSPPFGAVLLIYVILNIVYTMWWKEVVIIDVMSIAAGFVLRAVGGGVMIGVTISSWLVMCTILLSLFLAFCKRRQEIVDLRGAEQHRSILREYSIGFLDQMINVVTASTVVTYTIYTLSPEVELKLQTEYLYLTVPFVLYGIFRYLYLIHQRGEGSNPARALLADRALLVCVALWGLVVVLLLYAWRPDAAIL